jgi:uncharacterized hydrophobic protein (TIGR00271 family)
MKLLYDPRPFLAENKQRAIKELVADTVPNRDFYLLVTGAVLLATAGIFFDSIPVLIASMIVAPLAYPILLLGLGIVVRDSRLVIRSVLMLSVSIAFAIILTLLVSIPAIRIFNIEPARILISFSPNYFFDILIALIAGFVAAYGLIRAKVGAAMTGIGIAVSLMPPLVATGIEIASSNTGLAVAAFTIFILNIFGILLAGGLAFVLFGFRREYKKIGEIIHKNPESVSAARQDH